MMQFGKYFQTGLATLAMAAALSACGGGGGGAASGSAPAPAPAPAATSVPTAVADVAAVSFNKSTALAVLQNDTVTNGGTLALIGASAPAHGTATVSGSTIVYTPVNGFIGKDSFSYTMGSGLASATAQVAVTVSADLTVAGRAVDAGGNASIAISVGSKVTTTMADANGNFSAPLALDTPDSMISITAQGSGAQSGVKLISLVGDSQLAVNAAGAGSTLTPAMLPGLKVSNFSTALYAQATRKNGGVVPASQQTLDAAAANVGVSELLQMAALIRSVTGSAGAAPRHALPAGASDTLALVSNNALYSQFVKQILPAFTLFNEIAAVRGDANLASAPAIGLGATRSLNFYSNESCCTVAALEVLLNADGSGSISKDQQRFAGTWKRDAAALTLTLTTPSTRVEFVDSGSVPPSPVEVRVITREFVIRQVTGGMDHGFATIAQTGTVHYPGGQVADAPFVSNTMYGFSDWARLTAPADVSGATLGGIPDFINPQAVGARQLILAMAADGSASSAQLPAVAVTWKLQGGKLVVDFGSGRVQTLARLAVAANGEERWLARASAGPDYAMHEFTLVRVQAGLAFSEASALQRWRSRPALSEISLGFYLNLMASHLGMEETEDLDGTITPLRDNSWSIEDGALVITSYRLPDGTASGSCPAGAACTIRTQRSWTMLRNDAAGVFVFEKARFSDTDVRYRINRYERSTP
ncbi:MAG: Ig-like domain-containing protein [Pseudomonadota bacterium]